MTKRRFLFLLTIAACLLGTSGLVEAAGQNYYAAFAYSPRTGRYGYANGYTSVEEALYRARRECGSRDAVTKWARNAWLALAISDENPGGWGSSWATTADAARRAAKRNCRARNGDGRIVVLVHARR